MNTRLFLPTELASKGEHSHEETPNSNAFIGSNGYGNQVFATLTLKLMANNGGVVKTWTANNASSVTGTYADWYSTGDTEWIIEVTGTTSAGTTVTWNGAVRVAKS